MKRIMVSQVQRFVVDKSGLVGAWNLDVLYTPEQPAVLNGAVVPPNPDAPSLFTAVQEQFGLKLESSRGQVNRTADFVVAGRQGISGHWHIDGCRGSD